jgi:hypothetical protein
MKSANASILMDNMHAYKTTGIYTPEKVEHPNGPNVDANVGSEEEERPASGDFEDAATDNLPTFVTKNLQSSSASVRIEEMTVNSAKSKALAFTTAAGANDALYLAATKTAKNYKSVTFEADLMIDSTQNIVLYQVMFETVKNERSYMLNVSITSDGIKINDSSSTSGTASERHENTVANAIVKPGEWFNLRVEYYIGNRDTLRAHVYINDKLVYVSNNFYGYYNGNDPDPINSIDRVRFYAMNAANATLYVDNFSLEQSDKTNPNPNLALGTQ